MIKQLCLITLTVLVLAPLAAPQSYGLELGEKLPAVNTQMKNVDGKMVSLSKAKGEKGTLVLFTCNHCPYVKAWENRIVEIGNTYSKKGVGVVAINSNDAEKYPDDGFEGMQKKAKENGYQFPYVVDVHSMVARAFSAKRTPEAYLFDRMGKLVYTGAIDDNARHPEKVEKHFLKNALEALLAKRAINPQETKSLGCGIKYQKK